MPGCSFGQLGMPLHHGTPRRPRLGSAWSCRTIQWGRPSPVGEALRTEPTVDVIKLEHMWDRPLRFAHLWRTAGAGSVFSLQWRAGSIGRTWRSCIP